MKRTLVISGIIVLVAIIGLLIFNRLTSKNKGEDLFTQAKKGPFEITVTGAGELIPEKSIDIKGPVMMQSTDNMGQGGGGGNRGGGGGGGNFTMRMMDLRIQDIVPEGTIVKEGDYVAQLERTSFDNTLKDEMQNLQNLRSNLDLKILDTAVTLSSLRDQIKNQVFTVEEAQLTLDQSKYEPPATINKAKLKLDREKRSLEQLRKTYGLRKAQTLSDIKVVKANLNTKEQLVMALQDYLNGFTIKAPADGMIIYKRERNGARRKAGSSINPFDMVVATLPDLTAMISKMYVSEIEVAKVKPGQKVEVVVDAFPNKKYTGKVMSIANVGEQLPNSDAKMFETQIMLDGTDPTLRTAMTTGNKIIISSIDDAVFIPIECVQAGADSIPFVYLRNKTKKVVLLGESNDKNIIIKKGIDEGTNVYIVVPPNAENFRRTGEELIPEIRSQRQMAKR
ncbi:MAG: HlyD family efflux transporter periplasmic adaptor subunit [Bacteroidales bacterium]